MFGLVFLAAAVLSANPLSDDLGTGLAICAGTKAASPDLGELQPVNPATRKDEQPAAAGKDRLRTYELPAVNVEGVTASTLHEEDRVGSYQQPRWTTGRRFPNTRVYVIPDGKVEVEYWNRSTWTRHDGDVEVRNLAELEVGLPNRFQLDVYFRSDQDNYKDAALYGQQIELRWALADWGKIWGNPTLYFEYINLEERPDRVEPKLLLGGEIAEGWHWGANFVAEWEFEGPDKVHEYEFTGGISYTVIDSKFDVGVETKLNVADTDNNRGTFVGEYYIGPSIQWKPLPQLTVNFAPLIGVSGETPYAQVTFNVGYEF